ncbi:hypothetical protein BCR44DRAFT_1428115 [Catenaria anguillulae PL171]|uniref:Uncharacterized protein n=1 Tax=Catenaria anguillulae PL171 TaxID=765915 RepID=A0A1Y2HWF9_9FUNG|nr:hypothetical protein BCR44DRAFT_1428115 [Catenaria anguillulae PL171]
MAKYDLMVAFNSASPPTCFRPTLSLSPCTRSCMPSASGPPPCPTWSKWAAKTRRSFPQDTMNLLEDPPLLRLQVRST